MHDHTVLYPIFANHQIRHQAAGALILVIADGHFNLPQGLCKYVRDNIFTLSHQRVFSFTIMTTCNLRKFKFLFFFSLCSQGYNF